MDVPTALPPSDATGSDFLIIELNLANTFLDVAATTTQPERQSQSRDDAQKAYRAILQFKARLQLSPGQKVDFDRQLGALKERLVLAGIEP